MKLWFGDCLERMKEIEDHSIDLILCDLPYGTTQNKWDSVIPFKTLWAAYKRVLKRNGVVALNTSQPFTSVCVCAPTWNGLGMSGVGLRIEEAILPILFESQ